MPLYLRFWRDPRAWNVKARASNRTAIILDSITFIILALGVTEDNSVKDKISLSDHQMVVTVDEQRRREKFLGKESQVCDPKNETRSLGLSLSISCMSIKFLSQENNAEWGIANRIEAASLLITCRYLSDRITEEREHYNAASADCNFATRSGGFPPRWKCCRLVAQLINRSIAYAKPFARAWFYSCAWIDR